MTEKRQTPKRGRVERVDIQGDAFEHEQIQAKLKSDGINIVDFIELLEKVSTTRLSQSQASLFFTLLEHLQRNIDHCVEAKNLIDERGEVSNLKEFNLHMEIAKYGILMMYCGLQFILKERKWSKFEAGSKPGRQDDLGKLMEKIWHVFKKEKGCIPTAFQLWDWLPEEGIIQEKTEDQTIFWKRRDNTEAPPTSYKSFKNRYTQLKKKLSRSAISKQKVPANRNRDPG